MLQDIGDHLFKNEFSLKRAPLDTDFVLAFKDRDVYVKGDGKNSPLTFPRAFSFPKDKLTYLFSIDENAYFLRGVLQVFYIEI